MSIFLFVAIPIWLLLIFSFYPVPSRGWRGMLIPFLGGLAAGTVLLTITLGLLTRNPYGFDFGKAYPWAWYRGPGWALTAAVIGLGAWYHFRPTAYSRIRELACWFSGIAVLYTTWYAVTPDPGFDIYRILIAPFMWIAVTGCATWMLDRGLRIDGWVKYLFYVLAVLTPSVFTVIPMLNAGGTHLISLAISVFFAAGFTVLIYLDSRGRLS